MADNGTKKPPRVGVSIVKGTEPKDGDAAVLLPGHRIQKAAYPGEIIKAQDTPQQRRTEDATVGDWLSKLYDQRGLLECVETSTILPQCIGAYKTNIPGFGVGIKYRDEYEDDDETSEMLAEWNTLAAFLKTASLDMGLDELFSNVIDSRETYGIAYVECLRLMDGQLSHFEFVEDTQSMERGRAGQAIEVDMLFNGVPIKRARRFRRYKQSKGGRTVYFKEFGDPRPMDRTNGKYAGDTETITPENEATEILEFKLGRGDYGTVRWIGQLLNVDGMRRAENLNDNYFINGRHTPMMIVVKGGTLTQDSHDKITTYLNGIRGEASQHAYLVLETEEDKTGADFDSGRTVDVEIKDMAAVLQKDELFGEYTDKGRKKIQSAFRLPDLYTGYSTDYNRATAQTAIEVAERQVFIPERKSLAWQINNRLLLEFGFKFVEVFFRDPDITNVDDMQKILNIAERAGGVTPNFAREMLYNFMGQTAEDYDEEWGNIPLAVAKTQTQPQAPPQTPPKPGANLSPEEAAAMAEQAGKQVAKAQQAGAGDDVVAVLKGVKKALEKLAAKEAKKA